MRITTIRHGQTQWNIEGRIQGQSDVELNDAGLAQARKAGERLAREPVDIIYTSDLSRARKTAEIINTHHGVVLVETPALREVSFGIFEGHVRAEVHAQMEHYRAAGQQYPGSEWPTGYFPRVYKFMEETIAKDHRNIFIVSHFGTIRAIICCLLKLPPERRTDFTIENAAIHVFEGGAGGFSLIIENDYAHI